MRMRSFVVGICAVAMLVVTAYAGEIALDGVKCVMNPKGAAKADKFVEYKDGKVFFCCENCPKAFTSKVEGQPAVAAKANAQLVATKQAKQAACPFSGGELNADTAIEAAGASIAFCCENCQGKAQGLEGEEQLLALFGDKAWKKAGFKVKQ